MIFAALMYVLLSLIAFPSIILMILSRTDDSQPAYERQAKAVIDPVIETLFIGC